MSTWNKIRTRLADWGQYNPLMDIFRGPPEQSVSFTIAIIALAAKMAKADGRVTRDEVITLRQIFTFREQDEKDIARVFDLARQDVAGFDAYANRIAKLFQGQPDMLADIFESLFLIALADDHLHECETEFLRVVMEIFELPSATLDQLKARYGVSEECSALLILGLPADASHEDIQSAYRQLVRENHPDQLRARGLPSEVIALAEERMRAINRAYAELNG